METITIEIYEFAELSEEAKAKALRSNWDWNVDDDHWFQYTIDDAKRIGAIFGLDIDKVYFSGFSSQGDGACFEGSFAYAAGGLNKVLAECPEDADLHEIVREYQRIIRDNGYGISGTVKQRGHYNHSGCTVFEVEDSGKDYPVPDAVTAVIIVLRRYMDWIYRQLQNEYDYQTSEEQVIESLEANGVKFRIDGTNYH